MPPRLENVSTLVPVRGPFRASPEYVSKSLSKKFPPIEDAKAVRSKIATDIDEACADAPNERVLVQLPLRLVLFSCQNPERPALDIDLMLAVIF